MYVNFPEQINNVRDPKFRSEIIKSNFADEVKIFAYELIDIISFSGRRDNNPFQCEIICRVFGNPVWRSEGVGVTPSDAFVEAFNCLAEFFKEYLNTYPDDEMEYKQKANNKTRSTDLFVYPVGSVSNLGSWEYLIELKSIRSCK